MIDIILFSLGVIVLVMATFFDVKTKEIPNWLTYSFITLAFVTNIIYSIIKSDYNFILKSFLGFSFFFVIGSIMYYAQQWGGGDTKLSMGLGATFYAYPIFLTKIFNPNLTIPFVITILINILLVGAIYSLLWSFYLIIKNYKKFKEGLKLKIIKTKNIQIGVLIFVIVALGISLITDFKIVGIILSLLFVALMYLLIAIKTIDEICMFRIVSIKKLTEGDWIPKPIYHQGKLIIKSKAEGLTKNNILLLKKLRIKKILIREGIPFVPSILLGIIVSIIFGFIIPI